MGNLTRGNDRADPLCFFQNLRREDVRNVVLADDDLHVHTEIVFVAQNLDHAATGILGG